MKGKDPIEDKFRETFSEFEQEPPARVWEQIHAGLHPVPVPAGFWEKLLSFSFLADKPLSFYLAVSGTALALLMSVFYFGSGEKHAIRGHANAGNQRLQFGDAVLFRVNDAAMPWDSLEHFRTEEITGTGHFRFRKVQAGHYLLRTSPERGSRENESYHASWFDRRLTADSATLIRIQESDVNVEVYLVKK